MGQWPYLTPCGSNQAPGPQWHTTGRQTGPMGRQQLGLATQPDNATANDGAYTTVEQEWSTVSNEKAVSSSCLQPGVTYPSRETDPPRQLPMPPRRKIVETRTTVSGNVNIVSVGAAPYCVFVGKLGKETSEDDLKEFLIENGIDEAEVRRLEPKEKWHEKSAAFRVAVPFKHKDK